MTLSAQNRNFHWVNHKMVINQISGNELAVDRLKADLLKVPNLRFIPTLVDHPAAEGKLCCIGIVIPNSVKRAQEAVAKMLEKPKHFSFTLGIWTCSHTNNSFISLTAHWIDEQETKTLRQAIVLQSSFFPGSHTGQRIAEKFESMLSKWTIDHSRCHIVTDNAINITNAVELAGLMGSPCFIHTLQLAINNAILSQRSVSDIIAKAKQIVTHFRHSALGSTRLAEIQNDLGLPKKKVSEVTSLFSFVYVSNESIC